MLTSHLLVRLALCCVLSVLTSVCIAQTPAGYLGKRSVLELDLDFNPLARGFSSDNSLTGLGVGATYRYVLTDRIAAGLAVGYRQIKFDFIRAVEPTTEFQVVAELSISGSGLRRSIAPLGSAWLFGLGIAQYSGDTEGTSSNPSVPEVTVMAPLFRVGFQYRYIVKDAFSIMPWTRADFPTVVFGNSEAAESRPRLPAGINLIWRTGVSLGYVF